jgi:hypothetical protein
MAAHIAIGTLLLAILWWTFPRRHLFLRTVFFVAIVLVIVAPTAGDFARGFGATELAVTTERDLLLCSVVASFFGLLFARRWAMAVVAVAVGVAFAKLEKSLLDSATELCALHLVWLGVALGVCRRHAEVDDVGGPERPHSSFAFQDGAIFAVATFAAIIVSTFVLARADGSADEWAYTWQAAVFAKGHAYATPPPCENAFQNFYVFESTGRLFAQYTPGWPYFMAPFAAMGAPWLAGPFAHGVMAVGVTRVARTAVRLDAHGTKARELAAGWIAGLVATFGTTILLCGASRYSHVFVAAMFAWSIEALFVVATPGVDAAKKKWWGVVLGSCIALMGAARPADGAMLSVGLFVYFVYAFSRRRVGLAATLGTIGGLAFWGGLTLLVLRLQLGSWFTTGYSLNKIIHPWNTTKYGWPTASEWKFALPLATGSYAWFPASLAVGAAGLASLRRRASGIVVVLVVAFFAFETYYQYIDLGRGFDWGYGPRYELPFVVHMAVGMGVALAPLAASMRAHTTRLGAFHAAGPFAICLATLVVTVVRLWPLLYPGIYAHVHQHNSLNQRIRDMNLHHAIILAQVGTAGIDPLDLTENLPIDLYPNQDTLIAIERKPEFTRCIRANFTDRALYKASGNPPTIVPY